MKRLEGELKGYRLIVKDGRVRDKEKKRRMN